MTNNEKILRKFEEAIPEMQVSTKTEPRLLDENKVRKFILEELNRRERETAGEILGKMEYSEETDYNSKEYVMDWEEYNKLKSKYLSKENEK